ncbi:MAG: hypothetical protein Ct9H300mP3_02530 [Gammaproteobacteria bacterium]|nr:MAG: hypothetical protein Ct9H300mP3_02530 [Gammaproteobacteria bacterium]
MSGAVWGKPTWGTWWVWDARLTSTLILFFLYAGIISLYSSIDNKQKGDRAASLISVVGVIIIPIIKKSVDWWQNSSPALYFYDYFCSFYDAGYVLTSFDLCNRFLFHSF